VTCEKWVYKLEGISQGFSQIYFVHTCIYSGHILSNTSFTLNQALSALRRRRISAARSLLVARCDLPLECLLNTQTTQAGLATSNTPQSQVNLVDIAAPPSVSSCGVGTAIREA
jgi:hypothetical protein